MTATNQIKLDERNHVEKSLLNQLKGLGWEIIDQTDEKQTPAQTYRENFTEVVMLPVLRESLLKINPWLEDDQVDEVIKQLTANFPGTSLIENNRHVLHLLLENTSVSENRKTGEKSPTVRFIDFEKPDNNRFIAVCQFKVRILGTEHHIIPDIVLFLNGIPVVVIECKSPKVKDAIPEAIDQMLRYSEQRGAKGEGSAPLFYYNQFVVATCRQEAKFGTITTHTEKYFYRWADPYPRELNDLEHGTGSPNDQQRLVAGMLARENLLSLIRTFTLFSTNDKGQLIKIVGRYQQFRAVKLAVRRLLEGKTPRERSGIVWHTQGSGKSLTMMFMVREMYKHPQLAGWKIVFITDRTQLEDQLNETSGSIGFTVNVAENIKHLKELLRTDTSDLVMGMIHKFRETDLTETFPELNKSSNILVMTDEAHRSQYKMLAANLDKAIPNAAKIGYTGTPIDKTEKVFGDYIDKYTMRQSIEDGVTLEIVYEGRTHNAEVTDQKGMDDAFADVFSDFNISQRLEIIGYGTRNAYLEAESTIQAKAKDMVEHYLTHVYPNGYKAQVVATSREAAVRYKTHLDAAISEKIVEYETSIPEINAHKNGSKAQVVASSHEATILENTAEYETSIHERIVYPNGYKSQVGATSREAAISEKMAKYETSIPEKLDLEQLRKLQTDVIISGSHNDLPHLKEYSDKSRHERSIKSFKMDFGKEDEGIAGDMAILIVNNMLITGFDAPIEQVMYLDKVIRDHNLLQAIARVNRIGGETKNKGFVIDYVGIGHHLKDAISSYDEREQKEIIGSLSSSEREILELQGSFAEIMDFLKGHGLTDLADHDAFYEVFYDEEIRFEYMQAFRKITQCLNLVYPSRKALDYINDYNAFVAINHLAGMHFRDGRLSMKGIPPKLRAITDKYLHSKGIDQKVKPVSILHKDFQKVVDKHSRTKTKAAEIEHAIRHHIDVELIDDPDLQASFAEALSKIFQDFTDNWNMIYEELEKLRERIIQASKEDTYGLHRKKQMPLFRSLKRELYGEKDLNEEEISVLVNLTQNVYIVVERELKLTGFWEAVSARNRLKAEIQRTLLKPEYVKIPGMLNKWPPLLSRIMEIIEKNNDIILYAK